MHLLAAQRPIHDHASRREELISQIVFPASSERAPLALNSLHNVRAGLFRAQEASLVEGGTGLYAAFFAAKKSSRAFPVMGMKL